MDIGYKFQNKQGEDILIIDKIKGNKENNYRESFICLFKDGTKVKCLKPAILNKCLCKPNIFLNKIFNSKNSGPFKVIEKTTLKKNKEFLYKIQFLNTKGEKFVRGTDILTGNVYDLNLPHPVLKCYIGYGKYSIKENLRPWNILRHICSKCYCTKDKRYNTNGKQGVSISEKWLNFQIFAEYYYENCWTSEYFLELDKDILANIRHLENKIYSEENCILIPEELNCWLAGDNVKCGIDIRENNKYRAKINNITIGTFLSFKEAKIAYSYEKFEKWKYLISKYNLPNNIKEILLQYDFSWKWVWENMTEEEIFDNYFKNNGSFKR